VKLAVLVAVRPGVVTTSGPVEADAGTVAVILVADLTVNWLAAPWKVTWVAPVNPDPVIVTVAPIVPDAGLKEPIVGAAASTGAASAGAATVSGMSTASNDADATARQ
jgi:hypothetical protein